METLMQEKLTDEMFDSLVRDLLTEKDKVLSPSMILDSSGLSIMKEGLVLTFRVRI